MDYVLVVVILAAIGYLVYRVRSNAADPTPEVKVVKTPEDGSKQ